ncbi:MAG: S8 family serine peptidase [Verrucomicrobiales bacterium]
MTTHSSRFKALAGMALLAACSLLASAQLGAQTVAHVQDGPGGPHYLSGRLLVQFKSNATDAEVQDVVKRGALKRLVKHIQTDAMKAAKHPGVSHMSTGLPVREAIAALKNHPAIEFAEPNWVYTHQAVSNDPYYTGGSTWGLYGDLTSPANQFGSQAGEAWAAGYTGSSDVYVGIIDEGIQSTHPDLSANVWTNPFDPIDGLDNDGNGLTDDIHGWDFFSNDASIYDGTVDDHGTHVTGTIAATGGNAEGVAGINWNVTYISAKFLGPNGGYTSDAIEAVDYFTDLRTRHGLDIVALNNSWGGGGYSQGLHDAIIRAANAGILFVAAAGNSGNNNDTTASYPSNYNTTQGTPTQTAAGYDSVIAVAAIDSTGNKASWSSYGAATVDLGAPGVGVYSTVPTNTYASYNGTSMATPHVTGAAALYASTHPTESTAEIKTALLNSVTPTASLAGNTVTGGRLNLSDVIAPLRPTGLSATSGDNQVTLTWNPFPGATSYNVKRGTASGSYVVIVGVTDTTYIHTTAVNGTPYFYVVSAVNSVPEESPNSAEVSATPQPPPPAAPSGLLPTVVSKSQINLSWTDNSNNEDGFNIERSTNGSTFSQIASVGAGVTSYSNTTGLARNRTYYYRVRAFNGGGNSAYSNIATAKTLKN